MATSVLFSECDEFTMSSSWSDQVYVILEDCGSWSVEAKKQDAGKVHPISRRTNIDSAQSFVEACFGAWEDLGLDWSYAEIIDGLERLERLAPDFAGQVRQVVEAECE